MTKAASFVGAAFVIEHVLFCLLGVEATSFLCGGPVDVRPARPQRSKLKGVVFFFFRAHGEKCRGDDHSEKYQCKNKIVNHWGVSFSWAALAVFG
jgi:hypothetical protein